MFLLGMFWKRTLGAAAVTGFISGFVLFVFLNEFVLQIFGAEIWIYTVYTNKNGAYEILFQICMGLAFAFTLLLMIIISLFGPKVKPKAFRSERSMFKVELSILVLIVVTFLLVTVAYVRFW